MMLNSTETETLRQSLLELDPSLPDSLLNRILKHPSYPPALNAACKLLQGVDLPTEITRQFVEDLIGITPWVDSKNNPPSVTALLRKMRGVLHAITELSGDDRNDYIAAILCLATLYSEIDACMDKSMACVHLLLNHRNPVDLIQAIDHLRVHHRKLDLPLGHTMIYLEAALNDDEAPKHTINLLLKFYSTRHDVTEEIASQHVQLVAAYPKKALLSAYLDTIKSKSTLTLQLRTYETLNSVLKNERSRHFRLYSDFTEELEGLVIRHLYPYLQQRCSPNNRDEFLLITAMLQGCADVLGEAKELVETVHQATKAIVPNNDASLLAAALDTQTASIHSLRRSLGYQPGLRAMFLESLSLSEGYRQFCSPLARNTVFGTPMTKAIEDQDKADEYQHSVQPSNH